MLYKLITTVLVVGICVASMAFACSVNEGKENFARGDASKLKAEVARLTDKVTGLEKRIQKLEARQQRIEIGRGTVPDGKTFPKGWQQREFNGVPYYIVPLQQGQSNRSQIAPVDRSPDKDRARR